jgi:hypothetical protein
MVLKNKVNKIISWGPIFVRNQRKFSLAKKMSDGGNPLIKINMNMVSCLNLIVIKKMITLTI